MPSPNHAAIMDALEKAVNGPHEQFLYAFLEAYQTPRSTIALLRQGKNNISRIHGAYAIRQMLYFIAVARGFPLEREFAAIMATGQVGTGLKDIPFVFVTDYEDVIAYSARGDEKARFAFADLQYRYDFFLSLAGRQETGLRGTEVPADEMACRKVGRLYDRLRADNRDIAAHDLNICLSRLIFCFFAEDTELFSLRSQDRNLFSRYLDQHTSKNGSDMAAALQDVFRVMDTPRDDPSRKELPETLRQFPYVNGSLFSERIALPEFTRCSRDLLLECGDMEWKDVNPTIFGTLMQSVMDPAERRNMGVHYTSEENILKVIRPLFLDGLAKELDQILKSGAGRMKIQALDAFHRKLGSLHFLDPACGAANFLLLSFRELRRLEHRVIAALRKEDPKRYRTVRLDARSLIHVHPDQFHGIEIEEISVDIAKVSMALMEHLLNKEFEQGKGFGMALPTLPLKRPADITCADALSTA